MYQTSLYEDEIDYEDSDQENDNFRYDDSTQVVPDSQPEDILGASTLLTDVNPVVQTEATANEESATPIATSTTSSTMVSSSTIPSIVTTTSGAVQHSATHTNPVTVSTVHPANDNSDTFEHFQVLEQERKAKYLQEFKESPEFQELLVSGIRAKLQSLEEAKEEELSNLAHRVTREGGWLYRTLLCIN